MSRRSFQRKAWHSIYKGIESPSSAPTWFDWFIRIVVLSFIVYLFVVK
jgi:hypothetical protein